MLIVAPILYEMLIRHNHVIVVIISIIISYFTTNYSQILDIYGGGDPLFGGTYLILFLLGQLFAVMEINSKPKSQCNRP